MLVDNPTCKVFSDATSELDHVIRHTFIFPALAAGFKCMSLMDTGSQETCLVSSRMVEQNQLATQPCPGKVVKAINGQEVTLNQRCSFKLKIHDCSWTVSALVMPDMPQDVDIVLGDPWLLRHRAYLDYEARACVLLSGGNRVVLPVAHEVQSLGVAVLNMVTATLHAATTVPRVIGGRQARRLVANGCKAFLVNVKPGDEKRVKFASDVMGTWACSPKASQSGSELPDDPGLVPRALMAELIDEFGDIFADMPPGLPPEREVAHAIPLVHGAQPVFRPPYRLSPAERAEVERQVKDLLARGLIEPSQSPFGAPVLFVSKPDGSLRMCVDYRALNDITVKNRYPMPRIEDLLDTLHGATIFSSFDLASGYNNVRLKTSDVPRTAFVTHIGLYQYKVLCFGLTNAPATFQRVMNNVFKDLIGKCVVVYLDDICVFGNCPETYLQNMRRVCEILRTNKLYARLSKCTFNVPELKFLGHIVSRDGLKVDPAKISTVAQWPVPETVKALRSFLGLSNYFRRFIERYSNIAAPLHELTKDKVAWKWGNKEQQAFDGLKYALTHAPVLALPNNALPYDVVTDASGEGLGAVLMQEGRPVAFYSKKLTSAERSYAPHDLELLAIHRALQEWRCYLEGPKVRIVTDNDPLTFLKKQKLLSRWQARCMQFIESRFDYEIVYRPGRTNVADPLSRIPAVYAVQTRAQARKAPQHDAASAAPIVPEVSPVPATQLPVSGVQPAADSDGDVVMLPVEELPAVPPPPFLKELLAGYAADPYFADPRNTQHLTKDSSGLWWLDTRIVVPDDVQVRRGLLHDHHDAVLSGHLGGARTLENLMRGFWWATMRRDVMEYVRQCDLCQRNKSSNQRAAGLLQPLPIPDAPWASVSVDFIMPLPRTKRGHNGIVVFVDRLTKMAVFAPTSTSVKAEGVASIFFDKVVCRFGLPLQIVSDRDTRFASEFWQTLSGLCGMKSSMSSAFHPQSDGQTERMNRVLEDMIRHYISPNQDNWDTLLPPLEFAVNNAYNESVKSSPFMLNYGRHPLTPVFRNVDGVITKVSNVAVARFASRMHAHLARARTALEAAQQRQRAYVNQRRREVVYAAGDAVLLSTANLAFKARGVKKLRPKWIGPFPVKEMVGPVAVRLQLPASMSRLHDVFHVSLLKPFHADVMKAPPALPDDWLDEGALITGVTIMGHRDLPSEAGKLRREYLVHRLGSEYDSDEWMPEADLVDHTVPLRDYWVKTNKDMAAARLNQQLSVLEPTRTFTQG
jgi:hypothetical protein